MKKIFTLLALAIVFIAGKTAAQTCNPAFDFQITGGATVKFTPAIVTDSPLVMHYWSFGDGGTSSNISPTHIYNANGAYTVTHYIQRHNSNGVLLCVDSLKKVLTIQGLCDIHAAFTSTPATNNPLEIHFTNTTANLSVTDSTFWSFGDGSTSTAVNPTHTYAQPGNYYVCIRVKRNNSTTPCVSEMCHIVSAVLPCNIQANFTSAAAANNPQEIHFTNTTVNLAASDTSYWTFGDATYSTAVNPTHTYAQAGTYTVCLRVTRPSAAGTVCVRDICKVVTVTALCNIQAYYTAAPATNNPLEIHFTNHTVNLAATDSIRWTFGDGSTSNTVSPTHVYTQAGIYNVCLRVLRYNTAGTTPCVSEYCKLDTVVAPCNLQANFTSTPSTANPLEIHFTNTTIVAAAGDSTIWTFGDGSSSTATNPTHVYAQAGTYTVCLRVKRSTVGGTPCVSEVCKAVIVTEPACTLVASFTWYKDSTTITPYTYHFQNTSTPFSTADSVRWTFGDGTSSNAPLSVNHIYAQPGTYTVCIRVQKRNPNGTLTSCIKESCQTIVILQQPCNIQANYSWHRDSANYKKIIFTNLSTAPTANAIATWSFGDGTTATSWNATHEYAQAGKYYVCLKVQYSNTCYAYKCDSVTVAAPSPACTELSKYHFARSTSNAFTYVFTPDYIGTDIVYTWTFGDGTGSHDVVATHQYAHTGVYTVCLTTYRNSTCASTTCNVVNVVGPNACDTSVVGYAYTYALGQPNKLSFVAYATVPIIDQVWTITKVSNTSASVTLHQNDPVYIFSDTGYYVVCLKAKLDGGCERQYCQTVHIAQVVSACQLQAYPNPAHDVVKLDLVLGSAQTISTFIYNSVNSLVLQQQQAGVVGPNTVTMNINNLVAGTYTIKVVHGNDSCYSLFIKL
jgi:PKD repeat protein